MKEAQPFQLSAVRQHNPPPLLAICRPSPRACVGPADATLRLASVSGHIRGAGAELQLTLTA